MAGMSTCSNAYVILDDSDDVRNARRPVRYENERVRRNVLLNRVNAGLLDERDKKLYITVVLLCIINFIYFMGRFSITGISKDLKTYYSTTEDRNDLIHLAPTFGCIASSLIFGYFGDRCSRKRLLAFGMLVDVISSFSSTFIPRNYFGAFLFLRLLSGVGEASCLVLGPVMIADLYANHCCSKMLAAFFLTLPLGSCVGYITASQLASLLGSWQWSLRISPALGIVFFAVVVVFLQEPIRGTSEGGQKIPVTSIRSDFVDLYKTSSFIWSTLGWTCTLFGIGAILWFGPSYFEMASRFHPGLEYLNSAQLFQALSVVACVIGIVVGSSASQYFRSHNPRTDPLICAFGAVLSIPLIFIGIVIADKQFVLALIFVFIGEISLCMTFAVVADILLHVVIPTRRALAEAIQIFTSNLLGSVSSLYLCKTIADAILKYKSPGTSFSPYLSYQYSLYLPLGILVVGGSFFFLAAFHVEKDKSKCNLVILGVIPPLSLHPSDVEFPQPVRLAADDVYPDDRAYLI